MILLAIICLFIYLIDHFNIGCSFLFFFKTPCPTCGVTRAMAALLHGDLALYWKHQPMALFLCIAVVLMLHLKCLPRKKAVLIYAIGTAVLNFLLYLYKL